METFFSDDNKWQARMRDAILIPGFYERYYPRNYEIVDYGDMRAAGGCDTIAGGLRVDEKIVRWPKCGTAYDAFAFEIMSCTVPGRERDGWMRTNTVDRLLYCFCDESERELDCYWIDFAALREWFDSIEQADLPLWVSTQINRTACRIVPVGDVVASVKVKRFRVAMSREWTMPIIVGYVGPDPQFGHLVYHCHVCGRSAPYGYGVTLQDGELVGTFYCRDHRPDAAAEPVVAPLDDLEACHVERDRRGIPLGPLARAARLRGFEW